jgi:hypothetical protein
MRLFLLCAIALLVNVSRSQASSPVVMKVLVVAGSTSETSYKSIVTYLGEIGVPYQALALKTITPDSSGNRLSQVSFVDTAHGMGLYQGIILTDSSFSACTPSCLSSADWTTLNNYATQYGVRVASYFTHPAAQWGLLPADSGVSYTAASPLIVTLTTAGSAVFPYLNAANPIPVAGQGTSGITAYQTTPTAAANETTTPLMMAGSYTVAVTHTTAAGEEILALTMDNSPSLLHSQAFGYGVINWVTKGIFLGSRKVYLNPQIDDLLLGNWSYAPALHPACESAGTCPTYYATATDLQGMANWQAKVQQDSQLASYRATFAFDGVGTTWFSPSDPVFSTIKATSSQFWWLSHTWDHPNLDCYALSNSGSCLPATLEQSVAELNQNISVAPSLGIALDLTSMVTPADSGQDDPAFLQAAVQAGIKYMAFPEYPASPNTPIVNPLNPSILQIPRFYTNLYWDVSSPNSGVSGSWVDEYNAAYGPGGTSSSYSQNQTYSQIIASESQALLQTHMLSFAPYMLGFHMDNMYLYDGAHSLYTDLMNATISKYESLITLPVVTIDTEDVAAILTNRVAYNASGVTGVYTPGVSVVLTTTNAATIPVTGVCSQAVCGAYGGQIQDNVVMAANATVTMPLTANVGVSLASIAVNPPSVTGGTAVTGTVLLSGTAPAGGIAVLLSSNNSAATAPASITVPAGSTSATFSIGTSVVASSVSLTLTATYGNVNQTAALTVTPLSLSLLSISFDPASAASYTSSLGTVTLNEAAPTGGVVISLSSNNAAAVVPASVTVPAGSATATFSITTNSVAYTTPVSVTAAYNSSNQSAGFTVTPAAGVALASVSINPATVTTGATSTGTVTLTAAAPSGGIALELWTTGKVAYVPFSVTIPAGSISVSFTITTNYTTTTLQDTVTVFYNGTSMTAGISVTP